MGVSKQRSVLFLVMLAPALALTLAGCSSGGGSSDVLAAPTSTSQKVTNVMQGVVLPTLNQLGFDAGEVSSQSAASSATTPTANARPTATSNVGGSHTDSTNRALGGCLDLSGACSSGAYLLCPGEGELSFEYDACDRPSGLVDGSWLLSFNEGLSADYALSIGSLDLSGGISYTDQGTCVVNNLGSFTAARPEVTTSLNGSIVYCPDSDPEGNLEILAVDEDSSFRMTFDLTPDGASVIVELETSSESCTIDIGSGEAECTELV